MIRLGTHVLRIISRAGAAGTPLLRPAHVALQLRFVPISPFSSKRTQLGMNYFECPSQTTLFRASVVV